MADHLRATLTPEAVSAGLAARLNGAIAQGLRELGAIVRSVLTAAMSRLPESERALAEGELAVLEFQDQWKRQRRRLHDDEIVPAIRAGASGVILKSAGAAELVRATRRVHAGEAALHPTVARKVLNQLAHPARQTSAPAAEALSEREIEVLRLVAHGQGNLEIAAALGISEGTLRKHVSNMLTKLQLESRIQFALYAVREGLASLDEVPQHDR